MNAISPWPKKFINALYRRFKPNAAPENFGYVVLNLTRRCNMHCPHCHYRIFDEDFFASSDKSEEMSLAQAQAVLTYFKRQGLHKALLIAEGEVLLYPHLNDLAIFAKQLGYTELITFTNGLLLPQYTECALSHFDVVNISLDGFDHATYSQHRGTEGSYETIISNIQMLVKAKEQAASNVSIVLICVVGAYNYRSMGKMIALAESLGVNRIEFFNFHATRPNYSACAPIFSHDAEAVASLYRLMSARPYTIEIVLPALIGEKAWFSCPNLRDFVMVGRDGNFSPCNRLPTDGKYGNFFDDPEAYKKGEIAHFRSQFTHVVDFQDVAFICRGCSALSAENFIFSPQQQEWKKRMFTRDWKYTFHDLFINEFQGDLPWLPDHISCERWDIRFQAKEWYESEGTLRWSHPVFNIPFFLQEDKQTLSIYWASMRELAKVKITFVTGEEQYSSSITVTNPDWHEAVVQLPQTMRGTVRTRFEIHDHFFAPNDPRELGMAFKTIRFL